MPELLRKTLLKNGISEEQIGVIPSEVEAVDAALNMGVFDDLVMVFGDNIARTWKQIIYFNRPSEAMENDEKVASKKASETQHVTSDVTLHDPLASATAVEDAPDVPESMLLDGMRMIRDSKGVRLEDNEDEDGD